MGLIRQFRDPKLSLLQSSVDEVMARHGAGAGLRARRAERPDTDNPFVDAVADLSSRLAGGQAPRLKAVLDSAGGVDPILRCAHLAMLLAEAKAAGQAREAERYEDELTAEFGSCDPDWIEVAEEYARNLVLRLSETPYRRHKSLSDFVVEGKLPAQARVALVADWGTGRPEASRVAGQLAKKNPDILIHLGDVYYSGTSFEVENYFLRPLRAAVDPQTPCFSLAGNHDMYGGGGAYYNELLPALGQPASYFCLRNEHWQFLAIDTGLHDRVPGGGTTFLENSELEWVADKVRNAGGRRTVLLSHHPLFSAYEAIGDRFYNERLYSQIAPLLDSVEVWFWGHEHRLAVYEETTALKPGLGRGRCIGYGAFPVGLDEEPAAPLFSEVRVNAGARLGHGATFYNHGYALMELNGAAAHISYFEDTDEKAPLFEEEIVVTAVAGRGRPAA